MKPGLLSQFRRIWRGLLFPQGLGSAISQEDRTFGGGRAGLAAVCHFPTQKEPLAPNATTLLVGFLLWEPLSRWVDFVGRVSSHRR